MPGCLHRHVHMDPAARPFGQRGVPGVVENELLDSRFSTAFSICPLIIPFVIGAPRPPW